MTMFNSYVCLPEGICLQHSKGCLKKIIVEPACRCRHISARLTSSNPETGDHLDESKWNIPKTTLTQRTGESPFLIGRSSVNHPQMGHIQQLNNQSVYDLAFLVYLPLITILSGEFPFMLLCMCHGQQMKFMGNGNPTIMNGIPCV